MIKGDPQRKQQLSLFAKELIGFALLFAVLGLVVNFLFQRSIYQNIDRGLEWQKNGVLTNRKPATFRSGRPAVNGQVPNQIPGQNTPFRTNILVFNSKGRIVNNTMLGNRLYDVFAGTRLDVSQVNKVGEMTLTSSDASVHYFRTLLIKVPKSNSNPMYAGRYVLILENIDSDLLAIHGFRKSLLTTLLVFWILAIGIAYFLSRSSMRPILASWNRQKQFSANAAHELRTPLTVIQNQMEYMLTKPKSQVIDQVEPISTSLDEVRHLQTLTNRLLTLARSDADIIQINRQSVNLQKWLEQLIKPYRDIAASQSKSLDDQIKVSGEGKLDPDLIRQLIIILLDNAIKYTPTGGTVTFAAEVVHESRLKLEVRDTGQGIADVDKKHVFERFYRSDKSRNAKTGGNGLGLAIAQWVVKEHHGTITVKDNHPKGTTFTVVLPIK
ncbi:HAMP domain-containing histidine kinase [Lentilactobacillus parafarraginis]|uniref:histidine kinase n=2 Tax=Lentilactobacillus parafarraginis TaxID=390842 RepID=A0A0R1YPN2_9LACO|nr:HAMP domain-containing sensor histidine kinase [Lentilactobacillus parafarraginis]KRM44295.1 ATPase histidine kinase DNA gyrase B HSP90 domain protein [Lentilactobacillus parafarraginis DSM 18390 = JCM 14109]TLQ20015.1 HAMP domain-containing histidine kinase [Lentilactobacillus parafarraginis]